MSELYWLNVLGNLHDLCGVVTFLCIFVLTGLVLWVFLCYDDVEEPLPITKKVLKGSFLVIVFGVFGCLFIPSQKNLLIIYGVGGTIDYLKENKDANKIPDKCVKALDKYLDDALKEDKDKE